MEQEEEYVRPIKPRKFSLVPFASELEEESVRNKYNNSPMPKRSVQQSSQRHRYDFSPEKLVLIPCVEERLKLNVS